MNKFLNLTSLCLLGISSAQGEMCDTPPLPYWLECGDAAESQVAIFFLGAGAFGNFIDIDQSYGQLGYLFFASLDNHFQSIFFQDTQFFFLQHNGLCFSAGAGLRQYVQPLQGFAGVNAYYDYRDFKLTDAFRGKYQSLSRIGFGLEFLNNGFEARVNGYIPVGRNIVKGEPVEIVYPDPIDVLTAVLRPSRLAFYGFDGEMGLWLLEGPSWRFYAAGGVYHYTTRSKNFDHFTGSYGRAILSWYDYMNLELRVSSDKVYHRRVEGVVWFEVPFEYLLNGLYCLPCCGPDSCERIWERPVFRHSILGAGACCCYDDWTWPSPPR